MTTRTRLLSSAVAGLLIASPMAAFAAQSGNGSAAQQPAANSQQATGDHGGAAAKIDDALGQVSQEGLSALHAVSLARMAINDGDYSAAKNLLTDAQQALNKAGKAESTVATQAKDQGNQTAQSQQSDMIPILGQYQITEVLDANASNTTHIKKAKEHLKKGDADSAMDELGLAAADFDVQVLAVPLSATQDHVKAALNLLDQKKYHEANMALKAVEDSVQYNTISVIVPAEQQKDQQQQSQAKPKSKS